jgi:hypothetical protein
MYRMDENDMGRGVKRSLHSFQVTNPPCQESTILTQSGNTLFWNIHGAPLLWPLQNQMFVYLVPSRCSPGAATKGTPPSST